MKENKPYATSRKEGRKENYIASSSKKSILGHLKIRSSLILIGTGILFIDQFLKWLALNFFSGGFSASGFEASGGFNWKILWFQSREIFSFGFYKNEGIAFGLKIPQVLFYILVAFVLFYITEKFKDDIKKQKWQILLPLTLIGSGAASNLLDRIFRGYVVDYLHFFSWSAINLADGAIIVGVIMLARKELKSTRKR